MLPVVILAGGPAARLGGQAKSTPRALVSVAGEPLICHQLRLLRRGGAEKALVLTGRQGAKIAGAAGDGSAFGLEARYLDDGLFLLGSGGALMKAFPLLPDYFMVLSGGAYLEEDCRGPARAYLYSGKLGLMTVCRSQNKGYGANAVFDGGLVQVYDINRRLSRMEHTDCGLYGLSKEAFSGRGAEKFRLAEVLTGLALKKQLAGYEVKGSFFEVSSASGLKGLEEHILGRA
jgi:D-glycero-D-manno-heptose 1,7-bisphosphate phosphatase